MRYCGIAVLLCRGIAVSWYFGIAVLRCRGITVLQYCNIVVLLYCCIAVWRWAASPSLGEAARGAAIAGAVVLRRRGIAASWPCGLAAVRSAR